MREDMFDADRYTSVSDVQHEIAKSLIDKCAIGKNDSVLDIGCGDAKTTYYLATKTSGQVVGIDNNKSMIEIAKKYITAKADNKVSVIVADAQEFSLGSFDWVVSYFCLHMIDSVDLFFRSVYDSLKDSGNGFVMVPTDTNYFLEAIEPLYDLPKWKDILVHSSLKRNGRDLRFYKNYVEENGLYVREINASDMLFRFSGQAEYKEWLKVMLGQMGILPDVNVELFLDEAISKYEHYLDENMNLGEKNIFIFQVICIEFYKPTLGR